MLAFLRRNTNLQCYFCHAIVHSPTDSHNFECTACGCRNRYDAQGQIISDIPAMHLERLNSDSFSKRAFPSNDRLPTKYGPGPFCHSCQTNQMLILNLLANYLPDPESPEYEHKYAARLEYEASLHVRYPPVCESCRPQVEEELRRKEQMARSTALGGWLRKGRDRKRRVSGPRPEKEKEEATVIFWWRVRGYLWATTLCLSLIGALGAIFDYYFFDRLQFLRPILPFLIGLSLFWTVWDPTFASFRQSQLYGRDVRLHGKRTYNILQLIAWGIRMCTSILLSLSWYWPHSYISQWSQSATHTYFTAAFVIEFSATMISYFVLRIHQPPMIRLVDTQTHNFEKSRSGTPMPDSQATTPTLHRFPSSSIEQETLHAFSLSSKPVISQAKPIFGQPSLQGVSQPHTPPARDRTKDDDDMDWTPTNPQVAPALGIGKQTTTTTVDDDDYWLRPQRFFAPEKPTGLEGLFESTRIQDEPMPFHGAGQADTGKPYSQWLLEHLQKWGWIYISLCVGVSIASLPYILKWLGLMNQAV